MKISELIQFLEPVKEDPTILFEHQEENKSANESFSINRAEIRGGFLILISEKKQEPTGPPPWTVDQLLDNTFCKINGKYTKQEHEPKTDRVVYSNGPLEGPGKMTYCAICGWILKEELDKVV